MKKQSRRVGETTTEKISVRLCARQEGRRAWSAGQEACPMDVGACSQVACLLRGLCPARPSLISGPSGGPCLAS